MKTFLILLGSLLALQVLAQPCRYYDKYLAQGDAIMEKGEKADYKAAINAYNIAMVHCPDKAQEAQKRILVVFDQIELLRNKAEKTLEALENEQKRTKDLLIQTQTAEAATKDALGKANKLVNAFYFYEDRFALAYKGGQFYFIDKNGDEVEKLGHWNKAEQFDGRGFTKVERDQKNYLLDTLGNFFRVAYAVKDLTPEIEALDLSGQKLDSIPAVVYAHLPLKILLLEGKSIKKLEEKIGKLEQLQTLDLSGTGISSLPPEIGKLTQLQTLDLMGTNISSLPPEIGKLAQLQTLDLSGTGISGLPPEIGKLTQLRYLDLSQTSIENIPSAIGNLTQLKVLNLGFTKINNLPSSIGNLQQLKVLDLYNTEITIIPETIGKLTELIFLELRESNSLDLASLFNGFSNYSKPIKISTSKNLDPQLEENSLFIGLKVPEEIPIEIGKLKTLAYLDLSFVGITRLPSSIGNLEHLKELYLNSTRITIIPSTIGNLRHLKHLDLSWTPITTIPSTIGNLEKLQTLGLIGTNISSMPSTIGNLRHLQKLHLTSSKITNLPNSIGNLVHLTELYLINTKITSIPAAVGNLAMLQIIGLTETDSLDLFSLFEAFSNYSRPIKITTENLTSNNAEYFRLEENLLIIRLSSPDTIPREIGKLKTLVHLDLSFKEITSLPLTIGNLKQLKTLNLNGTKINSLPTPFYELKAMKSCDLRATLIPNSEFGKIRQKMPWCTFSFSTWAEQAYTLHQNDQHDRAYEAIKAASQEDPNDYSHWYTLSFYALFVQQASIAIEAAKKSLTLAPEKQGVESNLALGYVLNNQWPEAEKIYLKWKGKTFPDGLRLCDEVFLADIIELETAGITHPDFQNVKDLFKKE